MSNELILTIFIVIFIPFSKWYVDIKLADQTEELNKNINLNNVINNKEIFTLKIQLTKIIEQLHYFEKIYKNDVKILKSKLLNSDESISRETFK
jgi:hypothetical protein